MEDIDEIRRKGAETKPPWVDQLLETGEAEIDFTRGTRPDKPGKRA
jgi:hypothetical protein